MIAPIALRVTAAVIVALLLWPTTPANAQAQTTVQRDVEYGRAEGVALTTDVYTPEGPGPFPGLLVVHPGGFIGGDKAKPQVVQIAQDLAQGGYVVFAVNYRLAPDFPDPAAVQDVRQAVRFIRDNADQYDVDPNRIGAFGASAGGTIAMSAAVEGEGSPCTGDGIAAVASWSGPLEFEMVVDERPNAVGPIEKYAGIVGPGRQPLVSPSEAPALLERAEPITYLDPSDPPVFIANSTREFMPLDQARAFQARLEELGIPNEFLETPRGHALKYADTALGPTLEFLQARLAGAQCGPSPSPTPASGTAGLPPNSDTGGGFPFLPVGTGLLALGGMGLATFWLVGRRTRSHRP
jgi:acetyl esterase/lipase